MVLKCMTVLLKRNQVSPWSDAGASSLRAIESEPGKNTTMPFNVFVTKRGSVNGRM
jgi:hypothetical protein